MNAEHTELSPIEFTTSIRTPEGRLLVHVCKDALVKLGSKSPDDSLTVLSRNMPQLLVTARELAARADCTEVVIGAKDL